MRDYQQKAETSTNQSQPLEWHGCIQRKGDHQNR